MPSGRTLRRSAVRAAASSGVVLAVLGAPPAAHAARVAVGTALASGVRTTYDLPGYLLVDRPVDDGAPVAQAVLNSSGGATGFASLPYPGDTVVNAPAAASVALGRPFPFTYPFYVIADGVLTPSAHAQDPTGTVDLTATADDQKATGIAKGNGPKAAEVSSTWSVQDTSVVVGADGRMTAVADSVTRGIDLGVLKIGEVHVHSVTTLRPGDARPRTVSTTQVTGASVLGQGVSIDKHGISLAGRPMGVAYQPILDTLNSVLAEAGIRVALVGDVPVSGGASSSGLEIIQRHQLPVAGSPAGTSTTVVGNAMTLIVGGADALEDGATSAPGGVDLQGGTGTAPPTTAAAAPAPSGLTAGGAAPATDLSSPAATRPLLASGAGKPGFLARDLSSQLGFFYLVIVIGAGVVLTSSTLWRVKGVRAQWIS